jgi:hypothetical protein
MEITSDIQAFTLNLKYNTVNMRKLSFDSSGVSSLSLDYIYAKGYLSGSYCEWGGTGVKDLNNIFVNNIGPYADHQIDLRNIKMPISSEVIVSNIMPKAGSSDFHCIL